MYVSNLAEPGVPNKKSIVFRHDLKDLTLTPKHFAGKSRRTHAHGAQAATVKTSPLNGLMLRYDILTLFPMLHQALTKQTSTGQHYFFLLLLATVQTIRAVVVYKSDAVRFEASNSGSYAI